MDDILHVLCGIIRQTGSQCPGRKEVGEDETTLAESHLTFEKKMKKLNALLFLPSSSPDLHLSSALVVSSKIHKKNKNKHRIHKHRVPSFDFSKWTRQERGKHKRKFS